MLKKHVKVVPALTLSIRMLGDMRSLVAKFG